MTVSPFPDSLVAAKALVPTLAGRALAAEREGQVSDDTRCELLAAGLSRLLQPREYGGQGAEVREFMAVCAALAHGCMSSAWCNFVWGVHSHLIALYPDEAREWMWGEDPQALASASLGPVGEAEAVDGGYRLRGRWGFASGCDHAAALLLGAVCADQPRLFLIPRQDYTLIDNWQVAGLRATGSKDVTVDDVFVPQWRALPFSECMVPHRALLTIVIAGPVLGGAEAAVEAYASMLGQNPSAVELQRLAQVEAEVTAGRLLLWHGAEEIDQALAADTVPDAGAQLRIARDTAYAVRLFSRAVNEIFAAAGGRALHERSALQRIWRDVAAGAAHARLRFDVPAEAYARHLLGLRNL